MMDQKTQVGAHIAGHRKKLRDVLAKITIYYAGLAALLVLTVAVFPGFVDELPLGGVGDIAYYGSSSALDLEEAFLSADDEELEDIVTETQRAQLARPPAW
ncbi:MAG: hypothetical protein OEU90_08135, partial [Gammaproteobacteria bacterium]|nr:hypothetical protein [Gammaproteobacteria bacterium]